jgi:hypothetical protein
VLAGGIILFIVAMLGLAVGGDRPAHRGRDRRAGRADLPARHRRAAPGPWGGRVGWFTLLEAAHQVTALHPATNVFSPALSLLVLLAWPAVALLIAALMITRRDA